jgi:hypothetical protein
MGNKQCVKGPDGKMVCVTSQPIQTQAPMRSICSSPQQVVVSPTQSVPLGMAAQHGQMISAVPFVQAPNTMIAPGIGYAQALAGLPTQQIPNSYVQTTAGTRYQLAMGSPTGEVVPAATRHQYGTPFVSACSL